jgi:hypothetical protein
LSNRIDLPKVIMRILSVANILPWFMCGIHSELFFLIKLDYESTNAVI